MSPLADKSSAFPFTLAITHLLHLPQLQNAKCVDPNSFAIWIAFSTAIVSTYSASAPAVSFSTTVHASNSPSSFLITNPIPAQLKAKYIVFTTQEGRQQGAIVPI